MKPEFITVWLIITNPTADPDVHVIASATPVESIAECKRRGEILDQQTDNALATCWVELHLGDDPMPIIAVPSTRYRVISKEGDEK